MVEWLAHWTCNLEAPSSSPTMAASWICSWPVPSSNPWPRL